MRVHAGELQEGPSSVEALVRAYDWASTTLGPIEQWCPAMRATIDMLLRAPMPMSSIWGPQGRFIYNEPYSRLIGTRHPKVMGLPFSEAWPESPELTAEVLHQCYAGRSLLVRDKFIVLDRGDGPEEFWYDVNYCPVFDAGGKTIGVLTVIVDTTPRVRSDRRQREAQTALHDTETRYGLVTEMLPQLVWTCRPDGYCDYLSRQWGKYTGLPEDQQLGFVWLDQVIHPEDRDRVYEHWMGAVRDEHPYDVEYRIRRHDGVYRWFKVRGTAVRAADQQIAYWFGTCTDIQDIVDARELQTRLHSELEAQVLDRTRERDRLWNVSQDLLMIADFEGRFINVNPAWTAVLGYAQVEFLNRRAEWLIHPDDRTRTNEEVQHLVHGGRTSHFENRVRTRDGGYRWFAWTAVTEEQRIYATGRDITVEKAAALELEAAQQQLRQSQKMEAIGQLTGGIAHDLNNMLQGILGPLELLRMLSAEGRTAELNRYIDVAIGSANRAASLTHRLLAFARRQSLESRPVDVNALVDTLHELLDRTLGSAIRVRIDLDPGLWPALCDANQLESALLNLGVNARDAMPVGGTMTLRTRRLAITEHDLRKLPDATPGDYVAIEVEDTGVGMAPDIAAQAFDPFFTTKPIGQGTGLGLSMIYGFVRQSGGAVLLESWPDRGTRVRLYLPRAPIESATMEVAPAAVANEVPVLAKTYSILLVEDDTTVRSLIAQVLEDENCAVLQAADGQSALPLLESKTAIDLLITDVGLPGMNGRQLAEIARSLRPGLQVLFVTGYAEHALAKSGFLGNDMQMINKPFTIDSLLKRVRDMLAGSGTQV